MVEVKEELIKEALEQLEAAQLDKYVHSTQNVINELKEVINFAQSCKQLCECGGNERVALDCTMKPCKHPKYYKK